MSRDGWVALPRGAIGLSAVCGCGISWSYSLPGLGKWHLMETFNEPASAWMFGIYCICVKSLIKYHYQLPAGVKCLKFGLNLYLLSSCLFKQWILLWCCSYARVHLSNDWSNIQWITILMSWPTSIPSSHFSMKSSGILLFQMAFNGNFNITCKPGQVIFCIYRTCLK